MQEVNLMELTENTLSSKEIFKGKIIKVRVDKVALPDGNESTREIVEHADAVAVVAIDDDENVWMVRQYRKPVELTLLEIPAGIIEENEDPLAGAKRELAEETGLRAGHWEKILSYYSSPGFSDEMLYLYMARNLTEGEASLDKDEFLKIEKIPLEKAYRLIFEGKILDGKSIIGIQHAYFRLKKQGG